MNDSSKTVTYTLEEMNELYSFLCETFTTLRHDELNETKVLQIPPSTIVKRIRKYRYDFFSEYLKTYTPLCQPISQTSDSEDVCFICKDGGDVVICECITNGETCKKVYHSDCIAGGTGDIADWKCPRHWCDSCGTDKLKFICVSCPFSICEKCPEKISYYYGMTQYHILDTSIFRANDTIFETENVVAITCHNCTKHIKTRKKKQLINNTDSNSFFQTIDLGSELKFSKKKPKEKSFNIYRKKEKSL